MRMLEAEDVEEQYHLPKLYIIFLPGCREETLQTVVLIGDVMEFQKVT